MFSCKKSSLHLPQFQTGQDLLLPGGSLVVHVDVEIVIPAFAVANPVTSALQQQEDLQQTMLDTFVDIGPSIVLLVFED